MNRYVYLLEETVEERNSRITPQRLVFKKLLMRDKKKELRGHREKPDSSDYTLTYGSHF